MKTKILVLVIAVLMISSVLSGCTITDSDRLSENERLNDLVDKLNEDMEGLNNLVDRLKEEVEGYKNSIKEYLDKEKEQQEEIMIIKASSGPVDPGSLTLLETFLYDMDKDSENETINLYTSSQKDENGIIMWDDGQYFLLEMVDGGMAYELFNEYVQIGRVYFAVNDSDTTGIILLVSTYAGIRLEYFTYMPDESAFEHKQVFGSGDLNIMYNSMPWD